MKALLLALALTGGSTHGESITALTGQLAPFQTIHGTFTQLKKIKILQRPLASSGTFVVVRGKGLLWHTQKPFDSTLRIDPSGIVEMKDGQVNSLVSTQARPGMKQVGELLLAVFSGNLEALDAQLSFDAVQMPAGAPWTALLHPRDPNVARFVVSLALRGQKTVQGLSLVEANGDTTEIQFDGVSLDAPLSAAEATQL